MGDPHADEVSGISRPQHRLGHGAEGLVDLVVNLHYVDVVEVVLDREGGNVLLVAQLTVCHNGRCSWHSVEAKEGLWSR